MIAFRAINVIIACMMMLMIRSQSHIPDVMFEVLKNGGFRVYMPVFDNITQVQILINVNTPLTFGRIRGIKCWAEISHNGYFVVESKKRINKDDELYYHTDVYHGIVSYITESRNSSWKVKEVLDYYSILPTLRAAEECEELLLQDYFIDDRINTDDWIIEHKIPTYTGPRFVFNSYLNSPETVFIKDKMLHLQPIALTNDADVRGSLNLGSSCTSSILEECDYTQHSTFLLPPVKSAMLRSRRKFRYGTFEIKAKLPVGDWIFPIIQLARPTTDHVSVDELWIAFSRGNQVLFGNNINGDLKTQVLFAGPVDNADEPLRSKKLVSHNLNNALYDGFHVFHLIWHPDKLQFLVDRKLYAELNSQLGSFGDSESNLEYELQIGVGIGGLIDFPDGSGNKPWNNNERNYIKKFFQDKVNWLKTWNGDDTALKVENVRVTAL